MQHRGGKVGPIDSGRRDRSHGVRAPPTLAMLMGALVSGTNIRVSGEKELMVTIINTPKRSEV
jgi:hypothetical protein